MSFLEITNLSKKFQSEVVFSKFNFKVEKGEFVTILGPSGCGKSTLLDMVAKFEDFQEGDIAYSHDLSSIRMMFQEYAIFTWRNVYKNVELALSRDLKVNEKKQLIESTLNKVGLQDHSHKYPKELSGGMKQRVALAQLLASECQLMLMDEPFAALDSIMRESLQDLLLKIWETEDKTILFVTHHIREALFLGNRIIVLDEEGRIILDRLKPHFRERTDDQLFELEKEIRNLIKEKWNHE